jgi:hypothetical protein
MEIRVSQVRSYDQRFWLMEGKKKEKEDYNQQSELEERSGELKKNEIKEPNWKPRSRN